MKNKLIGMQLMAVAALALFCTSALAQTGENPKPKNTPRSGGQTSKPQPPPPPPPPQPRQPVMVQPVIIPAPVLLPTSGQPSNMQTAPSKSPEQIVQENREAAKQQIKKELFQLSADVQTFEISDVTKPFHIKGAKGFKVDFPEFAFTDEDGNPVLGDVTIKMTEYTSYSEFAASGLTTMTTDGEILETGGMINLEAKSGDKNVKLANGKEITITVPEAAKDKGFQTFYGVGNEQVKWTTDPGQSNSENESGPYDGYTIKMLKPNAFAYGDKISMSFYKNDQALETYVNEQLKVSKDVKKKILKSGIPFVYTIEFNAFGKIKKVTPKNRELTDKTLISPMNSQIVSILKNAPAFNMSEGKLMAGKPYDLVFATVKNYTGTTTAPAPTLSLPEKAGTVSEKPTESEVKEFTMKSTKLEKINCDRLTKNEPTDTANFHFDRADAMVYIVIKDMRAMINPVGANGDYSMTRIKAGSPVRYVAVIYDDMGNVSISSKDTNFKTEKVTFDTQIPFSAFNLQAALEAP